MKQFRRATASAVAEPAWYDAMAHSARQHGALPYIVEGFLEISDAVRRGHAVLIRRLATEVADGVTVFSNGPVDSSSQEPVVAVVRFEVSSAQFVIQDAYAGSGSVTLTPRRLQQYLEANADQSVGVALGR